MAEVQDVVVVGGGPVGVTALALLGREGLRAVGVEREPIAWPDPRAVHFDGETMRLLQYIGVADGVVDRCRPMVDVRMENEHPARGHRRARLRRAGRVLRHALGPDRGRRGDRAPVLRRRGVTGAVHRAGPSGRREAPGPGVLRRGRPGVGRRARCPPRHRRRPARQRTGRAADPRWRIRLPLLRHRGPDRRGLLRRRGPTDRKIEERESIPVRLSHVVLNSPEPEKMLAWYEKHLGFRLSDTLAYPPIGGVLWFLRCNPQHHSMAIARSPHTALNHVLFELRGIDEYMRGTGRLMRAEVPDKGCFVTPPV